MSFPKAVDEYLTFLAKFPEEEPARQVENPVWHIHSGNPPKETSPISFALLLNLVSAANADTKDVLWGFISKYAPEATPENAPLLDHLVGFAMEYFADFVKPTKTYRAPTDQERAALEDLAAKLEGYEGEETGEALQSLVFSIGKEHEFENLRDWFKAIYEVLLGQSQGPRFGGFAALYGVKETAVLVRKGLAGELG